ncbi:MAG TPA: hypothetical protein VGD58_04100, partial [Herpetosiphonaceae bacterium]
QYKFFHPSCQLAHIEISRCCESSSAGVGGVDQTSRFTTFSNFDRLFKWQQHRTRTDSVLLPMYQTFLAAISPLPD